MYDRKKLSAPLISVLAISLLSLPLFAFLPCDIEASRDSETLEKDYYMRYTLFGDKDDEYYISFDVTQGSEADIYIMTQYEYENHYSDGKDFVASFQRENILSVSAYWTQPDDQQYYLVVDNTDNAHSSDAIPTGDIAYDIEYKNKSTEEAIDNFIEMTMLFIGVCCLIIVVVIVLIIYFLFRKKRDRETVVIQGPQYYPPVQQHSIHPTVDIIISRHLRTHPSCHPYHQNRNTIHHPNLRHPHSRIITMTQTCLPENHRESQSIDQQIYKSPVLHRNQWRC